MSTPLPVGKKGKHPEGDGVVLEVWICRAPSGQIFTQTRPQSPEDQDVLLSWPSGGMEQAVMGLLTEAVRREALMDILLKESDDPGSLKRCLTLPPEEEKSWLVDMSTGLQKLFGKVVKDLAPGAFRDSLQALRSAVQSPDDPPPA